MTTEFLIQSNHEKNNFMSLHEMLAIIVFPYKLQNKLLHSSNHRIYENSFFSLSDPINCNCLQKLFWLFFMMQQLSRRLHVNLILLFFLHITNLVLLPLYFNFLVCFQNISSHPPVSLTFPTMSMSSMPSTHLL